MAIQRSGRFERIKKPLKSDMNVVPYIDVMLVLLVIFMVTAPMITTGVDVDLPQANSTPIESKENLAIVTLDKQGRYLLKDNDHKDETILLEPKTTLETKTLEDVKTDENSEEVHHETSNIDDFFDRFEKKVYSNIDRNFDKTTFKRGEFVNIRVTILKDGSYEQLTFLNGNSDYFNKVKPQIEEIFPLKIEENLKSHFPRYYRMKIAF